MFIESLAKNGNGLRKNRATTFRRNGCVCK
jgi:hypothetical protein